jgi:tetratricopeptide (TPR) repeat protein
MYYTIDPNTLREKFLDENTFKENLNLYLKKVNIEDNEYATNCSKLGDLYRINGELELAKLYLKKAQNELKNHPNDALSFLNELRLAIVYHWEENFEESEKLFDSLEAMVDGSLESFIYQHRAKMEYERNNFWLALNYFEKARRLRLEDKELLASTELGIHRVKMLLKLK